jgi:hypothetical protein
MVHHSIATAQHEEGGVYWTVFAMKFAVSQKLTVVQVVYNYS